MAGIPRITHIKLCLNSEFWFRSSPLIYMADREWGFFMSAIWGAAEIAGFARAGSSASTSLDLI